MGDGIGGVKKMGAGYRHSVALVLLASTLMILVATSHCMMSTTTGTGASNSTAASSAWCDGYIIEGQCILIAKAYGGGEHLDLDAMDTMVVAYYDSGETSSRRVLAPGGVPPLDIGTSLRSQAPVCNQQGRRYTCQNANNGHVSDCRPDAMFNRNCPL